MGEWVGVSIALLSSCLGGTAAAITRYLVGGADPIALAILRWGIGFVCLLPAAFLLKVRWPQQRDWPAVALLALAFFGLFFILYNIAIGFTTAARASLALATLPLHTMMVAALLGVERLTLRKSIGVCVAVLGVMGALAAGLSAAPAGAWRGELIMTAAVFCMAFYNVLSRPFMQRSSALGFLSVAMGAGAAALVLVGLFTGSIAALKSFGTSQWIAGIYLGVGGGAAAFILWALALERATPTRVASTMTVNPIAAALLATQLVGEPITFNLVFGLIAVLPGSGSRPRRSKSRNLPPLRCACSTIAPLSSRSSRRGEKRRRNVKRIIGLAAVLLSGLLSVGAGHAQSGVEKLYILNCGEGVAGDISRWSPGVNEGKSMDFVDNCYLIKHTRGWFLWDTGIPDAVAAMPNGLAPADPKAVTWHRPKTLASQLDQIGVKPSDVTAMAVSHTHPDHIGNVEMFPTAMLYVQKAEYEWPGANNQPRFKPEHPVTLLEGDRDVFGDGSLTILSTPGHTPGHQSLLVKLPKTGEIILTGDAVHFKSNWDNRGVPALNFSKEQTLASMQKLSDVLTKEKAQLWINHDKAQRDGLKLSPEFYD